MIINPLLATDSYKLGHMAQYPKGTELVYSNFTPRNLEYLNKTLPEPQEYIVWYGLQGVLQEMIEMWEKNFFSQPVEEVLKYFSSVIWGYVGPSGFDLVKIRELHMHQRLPLIIKALPEGTCVPTGVPCFTIANTDSRFYWLTNFVETYLSAQVWKPATIATIAHAYRKILTKASEKTGGHPLFINWQGHDFSNRGMSGIEDAARAGSGHLLSFTGSDTLMAAEYARQYYSMSPSHMVAGSVPATEHSVMSLSGKEEEIETFRRLISEVYPAGIVSLVSDTWDFWKVVTEYVVELKDVILTRKLDVFGNAKCVIRPDSGMPIDILCGTSLEFGKEGRTPQEKGAVECLWEIFGGTITSTGHKLLDSHIGLIYGDSITPIRCYEILKRLEEKGFASDNVVFGIGSYTYQYVTRDTCGFAMKSTYGVVNGQGIEIFKSPVTDSGIKKSAKGLLRVNESLQLEQQVSLEEESTGMLREVFNDGELLNTESFVAIQVRLSEGW